jgi:dihydroorotase
MENTLNLPLPDDFHIHLRQGQDLVSYAKTAAASFGRVVAMPNTVPGVRTAADLLAYKQAIESTGGPQVLGIFKIDPGHTRTELQELKKAGALAGKYYPAGATTNAGDAIRKWTQIVPVLEVMEELGQILSIHAEDPEAGVLEREVRFLPVVAKIREKFPRLKIIIEHVSGAEAVEYVLASDPLTAATVTAHHLVLCLDDMLGEGINPSLFCKPVLKTSRDREAIQKAVLSGNAKFFFGSDSAPHPAEKKAGNNGAAGIYSAPVALCVLAEFFENRMSTEGLSAFVSHFGADFYGVERTNERLVLRRETWTVPRLIDGCIPMMAGKPLHWKIAN